MAVDKTIFFVTVALIILGIVFSLSLTTYTTVHFGYFELHFFIRQLIVGLFSISLIWAISRLDPDKYFNLLGFTIFLIFLGLMTLMHFLPETYVTEVGGAKRWVKLPLISLAPVEFFKVGFIFFLSWSFSRKIEPGVDKLKDEFLTFVPYVLAFGVVVYLIAIMQNDIGQVIVLGTALAVMAFMAGTSTRFFMFAMLSAIIVFIVAIVGSDHRVARVLSWWSNIQNFVLSFLPDAIADRLRVEVSEAPYQITNSLYAIKNGGFFGEGLGNGTIKLGYLTEVHTDFVLAGIAEELGLLGILFVIILFFVIIFRTLKLSNRSENKTHSLFALGVTLLIGTSLFINSFGITGITPIKGIAVPFLSYGGSSLLAHSIAIGMVLMISKKVQY
ncbi:MAG: FtsW/RodA/SpoVE family cell cycle protein [Epsilonproteobacteria bacterium]|nr:FtsW/RodA/SpoVE family cell cycle protein [Campylobacterota bacterium]